MRREHVFVCDHGQRPLAQRVCGRAHADSERREERPFHVGRGRVGRLLIHALSLGEEASKVVLVAGERTIRPAYPLQGGIRMDLHLHGEGVRSHALPRLLGEHCAAPERDHRWRACESLRDDLLFEPAEFGLSTLEELRDGPVQPLDFDIRVHERASRAFGDLAPDRRLPRPHEADEGEVLLYRSYLGDHGIRSTYARHAATKSPTESPPNFSRAARASSNATHASATTASASTAATSGRSTRAWAGSPVSRSAEWSGRINVGRGFIAARTTISSPLDTPASSPPP